MTFMNGGDAMVLVFNIICKAFNYMMSKDYAMKMENQCVEVLTHKIKKNMNF